PKQAIYGFRGGDIHTYLKAKRAAQQAPVLDQNFRSRPAVLRALPSRRSTVSAAVISTLT
ncbi:hypothetical protein C7E12_22520, partial [Stenotrophomonas maltophilia]